MSHSPLQECIEKFETNIRLSQQFIIFFPLFSTNPRAAQCQTRSSSVTVEHFLIKCPEYQTLLLHVLFPAHSLIEMAIVCWYIGISIFPQVHRLLFYRYIYYYYIYPKTTLNNNTYFWHLFDRIVRYLKILIFDIFSPFIFF